MDIKSFINEIEPELVKYRRYFHQYPEASLKEYETSKQIAMYLDANGIPYEKIGDTGILAIIDSQKPGSKILLRADIDALEIEEKTGVLYASKNKGLSHACGHDAHIAMGLGTAITLNHYKDQFNGVAYIAFQPAEEIGAGAKQFIASGKIEDIDSSFAIHVRSDLPLNHLAVRGGAVNASCDIFKIKIIGKSSHVGLPHEGIDALVTGSQIVLSLQTIVSREISPIDKAVVGIGKFHSGSRYNIVANEAVLEGTIRAFSHETRANLKEAIERIVQGIAISHRCQASIEWYDAAAPVINDDELAIIAQNIAKEIKSIAYVCVDYPDSMGADDFADYQINKPGIYVLLGSQSGEETSYGHHHEKFNIDEKVLATGVEFEVNYIIHQLKT